MSAGESRRLGADAGMFLSRYTSLLHCSRPPGWRNLAMWECCHWPVPVLISLYMTKRAVSLFLYSSRLYTTLLYRRSDLTGEGGHCMAQYAYGDRIGRTAQLKLGSSAIVLNQAGDKILLTRRTDNGRWCLPGGGMEVGESLEECCMREVWEETGLTVRVVCLLGIYSTPHRVTYWP